MLSNRDALRKSTQAKNQTRSAGKFSSLSGLQLQNKNAANRLHELLTETNGGPAADALVNTITRSVSLSGAMFATQIRIIETLIAHVETLIAAHPGSGFLVATVLAPVVNDPHFAPGFEVLQQKENSDYWAAMSLDACEIFAFEHGKEAKDARLDEIGYLNISHKAIYHALTA